MCINLIKPKINKNCDRIKLYGVCQIMIPSLRAMYLAKFSFPRTILATVFSVLLIWVNIDNIPLVGRDITSQVHIAECELLRCIFTALGAND